MGILSYVRSIVDRNVVMRRRISVYITTPKAPHLQRAFIHTC